MHSHPALAQDHPAAKPAPDPEPDVLVLSNGDTLHGKFVSEIAGKVTFHSDPLGDVSLGWDKIKELHTGQKFAVLENTANVRSKKAARQIPVGTLEVANGTVTVHADSTAAAAPVPVKNANYIMDTAELDKQVNHEPGFFSGWNGAATRRSNAGDRDAKPVHRVGGRWPGTGCPNRELAQPA